MNVNKKAWAIVAALTLELSGAAWAASADSFSDVPKDHWSYEALDYLAQEGVIEGIFVNGVPLEQLSNAAAMDKARADKAGRSLFDRPHLVDSGMVPPKEE